ncbi:MAG: preprotein translocase subunit SecE [Saprospiraceae bacterium]|nr:preprotein translocase subunit SecE [Saprospiraceae bacterium]
MNDFFLYVKESYNELVHNVTWPTWGELLANSRLVIIASIIFALVVFVLDFISKNALTTIYNIGS